MKIQVLAIVFLLLVCCSSADANSLFLMLLHHKIKAVLDLLLPRNFDPPPVGFRHYRTLEVGEGGEKGHWRHEVSFRMGPKPVPYWIMAPPKKQQEEEPRFERGEWRKK